MGLNVVHVRGGNDPTLFQALDTQRAVGEMVQSRLAPTCRVVRIAPTRVRRLDLPVLVTIPPLHATLGTAWMQAEGFTHAAGQYVA
jgi:hypothetical protein